MLIVECLRYAYLILAIDVAKRSESSIERIFMDPTGRHLIVSMKSNEAFYLGRNNKKLRALHKLKVIIKLPALHKL